VTQIIIHLSTNLLIKRFYLDSFQITRSLKIEANTKISKILKANPAAIEVIAGINKHFRKLRNPILRRALAPRVTIKDAAKIGNVSVNLFLRKLQEIGFEIEQDHKMEQEAQKTNQMLTLKDKKPTLTLDVRPDIEAGNDPFKRIMSAIKSLKEDDILQLGFAHGKSYYDEYQVQIDLLDGKFSDIFITYNSNTRENFYKKSGFEYKIATGSFSKSELVIYKNEIYNLNLSTIFLLINKNSSNRLQKKSYLKPKSDFAWDMSIVNALSNIAKVSSYELQNLNQQLEIKVATEIEKNLKKDAILIHNAKLAQMGEMMSMIAHQWKQPLSAISATSSGLHIKIELDMYERGFFLSSLAKIEEFVNHLSSTIDDFSNFFKPSKKRENIKLYKIVEKAMTIASYSLTKHSIKVEKNIDNTISVNTHINELVQVILNIVKNAENILMARDIKSPLIIFKTYKKENQIYLEISDNGGGIDEKIIDKIFEPYFSTRATKDSTGLGLYMSQLIVQESLNGKLLVENSENGAVFNIVLV